MVILRPGPELRLGLARARAKARVILRLETVLRLGLF